MQQQRSGRQKRILIAGGGTGGHLFPGIAMAEAIVNRFPDSKIMFIGTGRQIDAMALRHRSFATATIACQGLKGKGLLSQLDTLVRLPASLLAAARIIRRFKPELVFGVGGYVTGPVILAARLLGIPCCIHEQNSVPGLTNRLAGRLAQRVFLSLPGSEAYFPATKSICSGNPVRQELIDAAAKERPAADGLRPTLLILGGSQGAHRVNMLILEAVERTRSILPPGLAIIHQTGADDEHQVRQQYEKLGVKARVAAFFQDMAEIYGAADLVVSRAGATTLAELMIFKKPAILIPFPYAADDHQAKNGQYLVEHGAARMLIERGLTGLELGRQIVDLLHDRDRLDKLAAAMAGLARPEATQTIVEECLKLMHDRTESE